LQEEEEEGKASGESFQEEEVAATDPILWIFRFFRSNPSTKVGTDEEEKEEIRTQTNNNNNNNNLFRVRVSNYNDDMKQPSNQAHTTSEKNKNWVADFPTTQFSKCSFLCENILGCHFRQHPISFPSLRCPSSLECIFSREFQEKVLSTSYRWVIEMLLHNRERDRERDGLRLLWCHSWSTFWYKEWEIIYIVWSKTYAQIMQNPSPSPLPPKTPKPQTCKLGNVCWIFYLFLGCCSYPTKILRA
jgi:hypothetical protein